MTQQNSDDVTISSGSSKAKAEAADLGVLWTVFTILGIAAIALVPIPPESPRPWLRMALPVAFMGLFAFIAWSRGAHSKQRVADSLYFMGFLWTLMALMHALLSGPNPDSSLIYTAFGYSLVGTFSGMFLRLMLMQFARDFDDQKEEAVDLIDIRIAELNGALLEATSVTRQFGYGIAPLAERLREELLKASVAWGEASKRIADEVVVDVRKKLASELQGISASIHELGVQCNKIARLVEETSRDLVEPNQALVQTAKQTAAAMKRQAANLDIAFDELIKTIQAVPEDPELRTALVAVRNELGSLTLAISSTAASVRTTGSVLNAAGEGVSRAASEAGSAAASLRGEAAVLARSAQVAAAAGAELQTTIATVRADVTAVDETLKEVVSFVDRHVLPRQ